MVLAGLVLALITPSAEAQSRRWVPVPGKSVVAFEATHRLGDFRGSSDTVTGEFEADPAEIRAGFTGTLRVPIAALRTGDAGRDRELATTLSEALGDSANVTLIEKSDGFVFGYAKLDLLFGKSSATAVR